MDELREIEERLAKLLGQADALDEPLLAARICEALEVARSLVGRA